MLAALRPFGSRNFRLYLVGHWATKSGTTAHRLALAWTVLHLPGSNGFAVGVVVAASFAPTMVIGPWAGVLADRHSRRLIILWAEAGLFAVTAAIAALAFADALTLWPLLGLALLGGIIAAVDMPSQAALISELVPPAQVRYAIATLSMAGNVATVVGPVLASFALAYGAAAWVFAGNALTYLFVVLVVSRLRITKVGAASDRPKASQSLSGGWLHLWRNKDLVLLVGLLVVIGGLASNFSVTVVLATGAADLPATTAAQALAFFSVGSFVGAALVMLLHRAGERAILLASFVFAACHLAGGLIAPSWLGIAAVPLGLAWIILLTSMNAKLQASTDDWLRGRVMSIFVLANCVAAAAGAPFIGWLSDTIGPGNAMVLEGAVGLLAVTVVGTVLAVGRRGGGFQRVRAV